MDDFLEGSVEGVVDVGAGRVRGRERGGVWAFLAIPYARSPAGPLRWRPPQTPEPWTGVRDAFDPGPVCPQVPPARATSIPGDPLEQGEDCLHLSVWTPGLGAARSGDVAGSKGAAGSGGTTGRPVMVWIHGGGFTTGTAGSVLYDGSDLARRGDVVVVGVNYRLGALGFLAHPAFAAGGGGNGSGDGSGGGIWANWGLLDQVAALRWEQRNIGAFGGDPSNVTLFGESAGAMSVSALLAMPAARGLFHRAIVESGPPYTFGAQRAAEAAGAVAKQLGIVEVRREVLEQVPASDLVAAVASLQRGPARPGEITLPLLPVIDGLTLPVEPLEAVAAGAAAGVPLIVGTNRDEMAFFGLSDLAMAGMDEEQLLRRLRRSAPWADAEVVVDTYRRARLSRGEAVTPRDLWVAAASDVVFRWPSLRLATAQRAHQSKTFVYLFTWETPAFRGALGSCHALEIPFVFGTVRTSAVAKFAGDGPDAESLSEDMQAAWLAFVRTGDPASPRLGEWPAWDPERRPTMVFDRESQVCEAPRDEELAAWEPLQPLPAPMGGGGSVAGVGNAAGT
ncbi:MAG: carboxylesterase/lipase family protein [Acidimicrobiales bacterium]